MCTVERAHRLGMLHVDRKTPRQVIVKYLNYKANILCSFRAKRDMQIDGHNLLMFADYLVELTKRNQFSKICTTVPETHKIYASIPGNATCQLWPTANKNPFRTHKKQNSTWTIKTNPGNNLCSLTDKNPAKYLAY